MGPMGRRLIGGALVAVGLIAASMAWAGFAASRTVLDPGRSEAIATDLYQDREVRAQLRSSMASALDAAIPESVSVSRSELVAAADRALDDPAVESLLVGGLIRAHQRFLGDDPNPDEPIVVDGAAMARASRSALVNLRPELANTVPEPPSVPVELPTERLPDAGGFRTWLNATVAMLAAVAVGLVVAAFVLTNDRPRVLRRVGFWAIGASVFWLLVGVVLPELAHLLLPGAAAILAAMWGVAAGGMIEPSRTALGAGVATVILSFAWSGIAALVTGGRREPSARIEPGVAAGARPGRPGRSTRPGTVSRPMPSPAPVGRVPQPASASAAGPMRTPGPVTPPQGVPVAPGASAPPSTPAPFPAPPQAASPPSTAPRWVEGVGYVDDPDATNPG
jgi:hypothetical protein